MWSSGNRSKSGDHQLSFGTATVPNGQGSGGHGSAGLGSGGYGSTGGPAQQELAQSLKKKQMAERSLMQNFSK